MTSISKVKQGEWDVRKNKPPWQVGEVVRFQPVNLKLASSTNGLCSYKYWKINMFKSLT